jgi:hypothetical protein
MVRRRSLEIVEWEEGGFHYMTQSVPVGNPTLRIADFLGCGFSTGEAQRMNLAPPASDGGATDSGLNGHRVSAGTE